jgi:hypothetical protein
MFCLFRTPSHFARAARLLVLLVALGSTARLPVTPISGGHCARHGAAGGVHQGGHSNHLAPSEQGARTPPFTLAAAPNADCDHCPAERCAMLAPCAGGLSGALGGPAPAVPMTASRPTGQRTPSLLFHSTAPAPPTPPPLAIA